MEICAQSSAQVISAIRHIVLIYRYDPVSRNGRQNVCPRVDYQRRKNNRSCNKVEIIGLACFRIRVLRVLLKRFHSLGNSCPNTYLC